MYYFLIQANRTIQCQPQPVFISQYTKLSFLKKNKMIYSLFIWGIATFHTFAKTN